MGWHKRRVCSRIHALLTDSTLGHAQRISIDPEEAAAEDCCKRSSLTRIDFKHQSYLWVDGGDGRCRGQRYDFRVQLWSLKKKFMIGQQSRDMKVMAYTIFIHMS